MEIISLILATAVLTAQATLHLISRHAFGAGDNLIAPVWQAAYDQGVLDERTSAAWDVPGYGPARVNPYGTDAR